MRCSNMASGRLAGSSSQTPWAGRGALPATSGAKAFIAWIVFMLLALSLAVVMLALSAAGVDFEAARWSCRSRR